MSQHRPHALLGEEEAQKHAVGEHDGRTGGDGQEAQEGPTELEREVDRDRDEVHHDREATTEAQQVDRQAGHGAPGLDRGLRRAFAAQPRVGGAQQPGSQQQRRGDLNRDERLGHCEQTPELRQRDVDVEVEQQDAARDHEERHRIGHAEDYPRVARAQFLVRVL